MLLFSVRNITMKFTQLRGTAGRDATSQQGRGGASRCTVQLRPALSVDKGVK